MNNMPGTIWATDSTTGECVISFSTPSEGYQIEYRRADLPPTTEQIMADPRVKALVEVAEEFTTWNHCWPGNINLEMVKRRIDAALTAITKFKDLKP